MKLNRIKEILEEKGISQTWLAKKIGKSFSTINAYACQRKQPSLETLLEISKVLSVDLKELITDDNERERIE
ncbi:helix-turn-helix domain-containing protein [Bacteroides fragilis]